MSGIQVQRRLRSGPAQLPVVFITASDDPTVEREALSAGGLCLLHKPFTSRELLASIASALQTYPKS